MVNYRDRRDWRHPVIGDEVLWTSRIWYEIRDCPHPLDTIVWPVQRSIHKYCILVHHWWPIQPIDTFLWRSGQSIPWIVNPDHLCMWHDGTNIYNRSLRLLDTIQVQFVDVKSIFEATMSTRRRQPAAAVREARYASFQIYLEKWINGDRSEAVSREKKEGVGFEQININSIWKKSNDEYRIIRMIIMYTRVFASDYPLILRFTLLERRRRHSATYIHTYIDVWISI